MNGTINRYYKMINFQKILQRGTTLIKSLEIWVIQFYLTVMMKVRNKPKPKKQQDLKAVVSSYFSIQMPRKAPLVLNSENCGEVLMDRGRKKILSKYEALNKGLNSHLQSFRGVAVKLHALTDEYYTVIAKKVEEERLLMNSILANQIRSYIEVLQGRIKLVNSKVHLLRMGKIKQEDPAQFSLLSHIKKPLFNIQKGQVHQLGKLLSSLRPSFHQPPDLEKEPLKDCTLELNKNTKESSPETIKKEKKNGVGSPQAAAFDLSCEEELCWGQMKKNKRRHEIFDQIIIQEASSCEDSLISSEFA